MSNQLLQNPQYLEFERKLKSVDPEEQEFAILQFGFFIDDYRDNADYIFLKLIDLFVISSNDVRMLILVQISQCRKVLNETCLGVSAQIVKKLTLVWESNDLLGKANVIICFGYLSDLVKDNSESLYRIVLSLDLVPESTILRKAAIETSRELCQTSSLFVKFFALKAVELIEKGDEFLKPDLLSLLRYAHKSPTTFHSVFNLLLREAKHDSNAKNALLENSLYVDFAARAAIEGCLLTAEQITLLEKLLV